ncbi:MAG: L,D-transpeptidase family protein [Caulobacteraceae bacterium]|nr:L,D-transpeptidase family protein [Caulobacteraceae bacterium]
MLALAMLAAAPAPPQPLPAPGAPVTAPIAPPPQISPVGPITLTASQVELLRHALAEADTHGFAPDQFTPPGLDAQLQSRDPAARHAGESELVAAALRYAEAVHAGRLAPADFLNEWGLRPAPYDPTPDFTAAVAADSIGAWLDSLPPPYTGYEALRTALARYREIAAHGGWRAVPDGPPLQRGVSDPRVVALRSRLAVEDPTVVAGKSRLFDDSLTAAVARAQRRYGLDPTGVVNGETLEALNVPVADRIDQIIANMERWRWLPPSLPPDRVQVNIAAAVLTLFRNDAPTLSMKAVTGRPDDQTPMLQSQIASIVLNPPWNVPPSIAAKELWPKEHAHPGYLAKHDFRVITNPDGTVRLQQRAGPLAALGHVKFDFANKYGVYLHDTPTHGTFGKFARQDSHGCVRLEHPAALAKALMDGDAKWTPDLIDQTIAQGDTTVRAPLPAPITVLLLYWTAFVGVDGQANFRADPYGWDEALMQRIAAAARRSA